jgi:hypothetical protein
MRCGDESLAAVQAPAAAPTGPDTAGVLHTPWRMLGCRRITAKSPAASIGGSSILSGQLRLMGDAV